MNPNKQEVKSQEEKNPSWSWWLLLGAVVGFAVLSLFGAVALVVVLGLG